MTETEFKGLMLVAATKIEEFPIDGWHEWWVDCFLICMANTGEICAKKYQLHANCAAGLSNVYVSNNLDKFYAYLVNEGVL